jgi:hypothetical protein
MRGFRFVRRSAGRLCSRLFRCRCTVDPLAFCNHRAIKQIVREKTIMARVFIEARPQGRPAGTAVKDSVVGEEGDRVLKGFKTQEEAIS